MASLDASLCVNIDEIPAMLTMIVSLSTALMQVADTGLMYWIKGLFALAMFIKLKAKKVRKNNTFFIAS